MCPPGKMTVAYVTGLEQVRGGVEDGAGYGGFLAGGSKGRLV